jgi:hypothetical protein
MDKLLNTIVKLKADLKKEKQFTSEIRNEIMNTTFTQSSATQFLMSIDKRDYEHKINLLLRENESLKSNIELLEKTNFEGMQIIEKMDKKLYELRKN